MSTGEQLRAALAEVDCLNADIAELVALLKHQTAMIERQSDFNDDGDGRMIERAKAAIAKHGGGL